MVCLPADVTPTRRPGQVSARTEATEPRADTARNRAVYDRPPGGQGAMPSAAGGETAALLLLPLALCGLLRPVPFQVAQRDALPVLVAGLPEDRDRILVSGDRLLEPLHLRQHEAEADQRQALAVPVAGLPVDGYRVLVGADRLLEPPHLHQRESQVVQRLALAAPVVGLPVDGRRVLVSADRLFEPPHPMQRVTEVGQRGSLVALVV